MPSISSTTTHAAKAKTSPQPTPTPVAANKPADKSIQLSVANFSWAAYIERESGDAAPVHAFKHVPLSDFWKKINDNIKVEVVNKDPPPANALDLNNANSTKITSKTSYYWFASVIKYAGYLAKLRYVGFEDDSSADFWVHMCDTNLHPVGWAAEADQPIVPPFAIANKTEDWKEYLIAHLTGFKTLPKNFHKRVSDSLKSKFKKGMTLELVDKNKLSRMRVARVIENIGGRIRMKYENSDDFDDFWCHQSSEIIHPIGWSVTVGHEIYSTEGNVGFNFPSQQHAKHFYKVVIKTSEERNELIKKLTKSSRQSKMFSSCDVEENAKAKTPRMSIKSQSVDVYTEDEVTVRTCLLFIV